MEEKILNNIKSQVKYLKKVDNGYYKEKFKKVDLDKIKSLKDLKKIPLTTKEDLRKSYPLGLMACDSKEVVRIHSTSGTTGTPVIVPYTQQDIDDWTDMFARCYQMIGVDDTDRVQITPGYGLWTAGISFQQGAEKVGAMVIPMGPGNTEKQLKMMEDMETTVLCATSSYALLLAEKIHEKDIKDHLFLKKGLIGSEQWGPKMRKRIENYLGAKLYDIYGLTELYGPGVAVGCDEEKGMHYWDDYFYFEIIDPDTQEILPPGENGELVITTLRKEGAPLIRYRTHDLTRIIPETCSCGSHYPRIDTLYGRTDDMVKVKGVKIFPKQIEILLSSIIGVSSEYQIMINHLNGKDYFNLYFELEEGYEKKEIEQIVCDKFKEEIGISIHSLAVEVGELPRSEKKTTRIFDDRY